MDGVKFTIEQMVFHKANPSVRGMITGILFRPDVILYCVAWPDMDEKEHYACELTTEHNYTEKPSN